jgi:BASS family bile acid:Na+ symporter
MILRDSSLVLLLAIATGLALPAPASFAEPLITPALLLMMSFSLTEIDLRAKGNLREGLWGFFINYILLSGLILALAFTVEKDALRQGLVVMAAVPPAVAVLPLTRLLKGDVRLSLYGEALSYGAALLLMPGLIFLFSGQESVSVGFVAKTSLILILLPIIASRYLKRLDLDPVLPINLGLFVVTYVIIGLNRGAFLGDVGDLAAIALARTFVIGSAIYLIARAFGASPEKRISYTLFASYKNLGLAAAVSVVLFGPEAGIPAAVCIMAENGFFILLALARNRANLI